MTPPLPGQPAHTHPHVSPQLNFAQRFVQQSAAIEGQDIPDAEVQGSGHMSAYVWMLNSAQGTEPIDQDDLFSWQMAIGQEQQRWGDNYLPAHELGAYRRHPIYLFFSGTGKTEGIGSGWQDVAKDMTELLAFANLTFRADMDALARAAHIHWTFERIHPFSDGNGRTGRLLALWYLKRHGAAPVLFTNYDKGETYYPCFSDENELRMVRYFQTHQVENWDD